MIVDVAEREIESWPVGKAFALAPRMQAITLDVIMAGIFGIEGKPSPGTPEHAAAPGGARDHPAFPRPRPRRSARSRTSAATSRAAP